ncbi:Glutamyl-tRNA(Gln) amidotransferase subunit [Sphaerulina musiva]
MQSHYVLVLALPFVLATFDAREATISSTHHALFTGLATCREVVSSFLSRIEAFNNETNAIISLNPRALEIADEYDGEIQRNHGSYGSLFCVPTLLKDNYDTADMRTTGGSVALRESQPTLDAPAVKVLKDSGAIIIGKANLHELALEGLSVSSLGGQTMNPYDRTRTPGGSSGGTGAAIAASFAVWGTGTDTVNSLRSPASANGLFSCRPTRGLISRSGVIPISYTQDVLGPIGRCVKDIAVALTVMAGTPYDPSDNATALVPSGIRGSDFSQGLTQGSLEGLRFGLLEGFFNRTVSDETDPVNQAMANMTAKLQAAGATIIPITDKMYNATAIARLDTQRYEFRESLDAYLQRPSLSGSHPATTNELYTSDEYLVIPAQYEYVNTALLSSTANTTTSKTKPSYATIMSRIHNLTLALHATLVENRLDALLYPEQKNLVVKIGSPSQSGRNGILAALTGTPVVTVPVGFSAATEDAPEGVPIGMEILGSAWTEGKLLQIASHIERLGRVRRSPRWALKSVEVKEYLQDVPVIVPDAGNVNLQAYPLGTIHV